MILPTSKWRSAIHSTRRQAIEKSGKPGREFASIHYIGYSCAVGASPCGSFRAGVTVETAFDTVAVAITLANDSDYRLAASVSTADLQKAQQCVALLEAGVCGSIALATAT